MNTKEQGREVFDTWELLQYIKQKNACWFDLKFSDMTIEQCLEKHYQLPTNNDR